MNELSSEDEMPFGKFKGTKMAKLPDWYIRFLHQELPWTPWNKPVIRYIEKYRSDIINDSKDKK